MLKLYSFDWDCGRMGDLEGIFVAEESDVNNVLGKEIYFGEVLGKHSEISGEIVDGDIKVIDEDQQFITKLLNVFGLEEDGGTLSGHNPLDYLEDA